MARWQYQAMVEPVSTSKETVLVDKWAPNTQVPQRGWARRAVYSLAALTTFSNFSIDAKQLTLKEAVTLDRWQGSVSQPRFDRKRNQRLYPSSFLVKATPFPEAVTLDRWQQPQSQPRLDLKRKQYLYPAQFRDPKSLPNAVETITLDKWKPELGTPRRAPRATPISTIVSPLTVPTPVIDTGSSQGGVSLIFQRTRQYQSLAAPVGSIPNAETITLDKWFREIQQPRFDAKRRQFQYPAEFRSFVDAVSLDRWFMETQQPRFDRRRWQHLYPARWLDVTPLPNPPGFPGPRVILVAAESRVLVVFPENRIVLAPPPSIRQVTRGDG